MPRCQARPRPRRPRLLHRAEKTRLRYRFGPQDGPEMSFDDLRSSSRLAWPARARAPAAPSRACDGVSRRLHHQSECFDSIHWEASKFVFGVPHIFIGCFPIYHFLHVCCGISRGGFSSEIPSVPSSYGSSTGPLQSSYPATWGLNAGIGRCGPATQVRKPHLPPHRNPTVFLGGHRKKGPEERSAEKLRSHWLRRITHVADRVAFQGLPTSRIL